MCVLRLRLISTVCSPVSEVLLDVHSPDVLDMPVDPNEPTYCLCAQVSYGEMIGCDNTDVSTHTHPHTHPSGCTCCTLYTPYTHVTHTFHILHTRYTRFVSITSTLYTHYTHAHFRHDLYTLWHFTHYACLTCTFSTKFTWYTQLDILYTLFTCLGGWVSNSCVPILSLRIPHPHVPLISITHHVRRWMKISLLQLGNKAGP